jgi:hypothetical protein
MRAVLFGSLIMALLFLAPPAVRGEQSSLMTRFSINHPFQVPGLVLQPNTRYVIRLANVPGSRNLVQIFNDDQTQLLTMFMAVSAERPEKEHASFTFIKTEPGFPFAIRKWFYGQGRGLEFVYPTEQAAEIANHAGEAVLAADTGSLKNLDDVRVQEVRPVNHVSQMRELPRTHGQFAVVVLAGVLCLGAGLGFTVLAPKV